MSRRSDIRDTARLLGGAVITGVRPFLRKAMGVIGLFTVVVVGLAFTRVPFDVHRWLGTAAGECRSPVQWIVVLGGSGMPSGPELRRLLHAAELAKALPAAKVLVVHPGDSAVIGAMVRELRLRGVGEERIRNVNEGDNTREQALVAVRELSGKNSLALVTAPENMFRTVQAFRKAGFSSVCGAAPWDHAMDHRFAYAHERIGGKPWAPDMADHTGLRYTFWNYLKLEITCLREFAALAYYWLNGWV